MHEYNVTLAELWINELWTDLIEGGNLTGIHLVHAAIGRENCSCVPRPRNDS